MKEKFNQAYIALPIKESPLLTLVNSLNEQKKFFHMTLYFLGEIDEDELLFVKDILNKKPSKLKNFVLTPDNLGLMGIHQKTHVLKLKETDDMFEFRIFLEENLPNYKSNNLPFQPHITIRSYDKAKIPTSVAKGHLTKQISPYESTSIGVYYKTEEGATALLYSHKSK